MSASIPEFDTVMALCREQLADITYSLNACFEENWSLELGEPAPWQHDSDTAQALVVPGIVVSFLLGEEGGYLVAIPETLPLPEWIRHPDESQHSRLQTLALEWSYQLLPEEAQSGKSHAIHSQDLSMAIKWATPTAQAQMLPLRISGANDTSTFYVIGPVETLPMQAEPEEEYEQDAYETSGYNYREENLEAVSPHLPIETEELVNRVRRLLHLKVQVSVRLAEMKIELASLTNFCPGMLLVFPKSCDDLLDLYVNNQLYAQGEAVKIGEKFGLKINLVGAKKQRKAGVFSL